MVKRTIKLASPSITEEAIDKVTEVLRSGNLVQGKYVSEFEHAVTQYLKVKHAIIVSSGTAALHLSLKALDIQPEDEVIVPAFTFPATANVVELVGAKPVLVDISLEDYCIDPELIEKFITPKTKAIIPVHEFGQASNMEQIMTIAKKHHLAIIEDAACALGTEFNGQKIGTFGQVGCFSLHPRKAITTGEGGIIVTNDADIAHQLNIWRNHGIERSEKIDFVLPGYNYRMTDFQAALGTDQLKHFDTTLACRSEQARRYKDLLSNVPNVKLPKEYGNRKMTWQTFHVLINKNQTREMLLSELRTKGIECNIGAQALHVLQYYKNKYQFEPDNFPNAYKAYTQGLALPLGQHLESDDIPYICNELKRIIG